MPQSVPFALLMQGDVLGALGWVFSENYIPYGILMMYITILIFAIAFSKSRSYAIAGIVVIVFSTIVGVFLPAELENMILIILVALGAILLIRIFQ